MYFFSGRSDVELQAADVGDGGPAREGAPRHEKERLRGWEVEWLWGQSSVWRIYRRCCKEVDYFKDIFEMDADALELICAPADYTFRGGRYSLLKRLLFGHEKVKRIIVKEC